MFKQGFDVRMRNPHSIPVLVVASFNDGFPVVFNFEDSDRFDLVRIEGNAGPVEVVVQLEGGNWTVK